MTQYGPPRTAARERAAKLDWIDSTSIESGTGCRDWPWPAATRKGYGQLWLDGQMRLVGHLILERSGRPRPSAAHQQLHSCDRPTCAAPWHLRWGTPTENMADKVARNRVGGGSQPGEMNNQAKLTDEDVRAIRASTLPHRQIADMFGICSSNVSMIRTGQRWSHVA